MMLITLRRIRSLTLLGLLAGCGAPAAVTPVEDQLAPAIQAAAGKYPLVAIAIDTTSVDTSDAALIASRRRPATLTFVDSTLTAEGLRNGTWMFGPPVTEAEADGCPAPKVLGRRLARIVWREVGKRAGMKLVTVEVKGVGQARFTSIRMYYYPDQLEGAWAGDPEHS